MSLSDKISTGFMIANVGLAIIFLLTGSFDRATFHVSVATLIMVSLK